jgi:eukaryotic-like serine/threonine-protein kinase
MADPRTRTRIRSRIPTSIRDAPGVGVDWQPQARPERVEPVFPRGGLERLGRYAICQQICSGGMASVHLGFLLGSGGFSRVVAIKRMHPELARDASLVARFEQEVRLGARIQHPNVVQALDVVSRDDELLLVMEFIHGETLAGLVKAAGRGGAALPLEVALNIVTSALHGLHVAHEARDENDVPLALVHRDFSPQNVLVGSDGYARVLDFGIAKTLTQAIKTDIGALAGKVPYMAPEQLHQRPLDRRTDVFAAGVVLWEALVGKRLFGATHPDSPATMLEVLQRTIVPPGRLRSGIPESVDVALLRALNREPTERFASAREFALALEATGLVCGQTKVAECLRELCGERLAWLTEQQELAAQSLARARRIPASEPALESNADGRAQATAGGAESETSIEPATLRGGRARRRWATFASLLALLVLGGAMARLALHSRPSEPPATSPVATQPAPAEMLFSAASAPRAIAAADDPAKVGALMPLAEPAASVPPAPFAAPQPAAPRTGTKSVVKSSNASCVPPTYLDARGIRHFKEQCL